MDHSRLLLDAIAVSLVPILILLKNPIKKKIFLKFWKPYSSYCLYKVNHSQYDP